ncbi:OmpA family protein [Methylomonas koyamae]|uniref:OmpA family protein n=1 Tax=Methylomonas koyamae TaxID=702114 RepID=UPI00112E5B0C|nr:OmpA family protein [Methylomonas koyamae]TPQ25443.1 hypothetical protein C2U68_15140 [Methylomonas koyamae]
MKKKRNLDRDGLDGILPDLRKGVAAPASASSREATAAKPHRAKVIPLFTALGALVAAALWLDRYVPSPPVAGTDSLASAAGGGAGTDSKQSAILAPSPAIADGGKAEPVAAASPNQAEQTIDAHPPAEDILAQLPTEPTAAGIPKTTAGSGTDVNAPAGPRFTVYFKFDSSQLTSQSSAAVGELLAAAQSCSGKVRLLGHTCNLGTDAGNRWLGQIRANTVKKMLVARGVPPQNIVTASDGMAQPAAPNDTKAGQALNRRVELHCLDQ